MRWTCSWPTYFALLCASACVGPSVESPAATSSGAELAPELLAEAGLEPVEVPEPSAPPVASEPRAWLYRVSGGDGAAPSYLLGTMHVGVSFTRALPSPLDAALFDARALVMEIDLREAARYFREGPRIRRARREWVDRALPPGTWSRLTTELSYVAAPEEIAPVPAGLLAIYLRQVRMAEVEALEDGWEWIPGTASPTHLDRWIFDWAVTCGMPIVALETPGETVRALSTFSRGSALDALRTVVDDPDAARDMARRLRHAYLSLEEAEVLAVLADMSEEERHATFDVRNQAWLARLLPEIRQGGAFVAVGLGHLLGESGLPELLRAQGYEVARVLGNGGLVPSEGAADMVWTRAPPRPPY